MNEHIPRIRIKLLIPTVVVLGLAGVNAQTTWYVDDDAPNDPGPGDSSISDPLEDGSTEHPFDAIQEGVDAAVNGDTVLVLDGTYTGAGNRNVDVSGRLITVRSENGAATCIIDCEQVDRAFKFGVIDSTGAVLDGFTIRNGHQGGWGGALLVNHAGGPTVTRCVFVGNSAQVGGALSNVESQPEFIGCSFIDNSAAYQGGSIYNLGYLTIVDCQFNGNSVSGADPLYGGGGIYIDGKAASISNSNFEGNSARQGGAIFIKAGYAALTDCDFSGNSASYRGGAIYNLWLYYSPPELERCTFTGNSAGWDGGAIFNDDDSMITVSDCAFTANWASSGGGALCNMSCSATIVGGAFSRNVGFYGGAVYSNSSDATLTSCAFAGNTAQQGGAIFNTGGSTAIMNGAFCGNNSEYGGGIMVESGNSSATNSSFCANEATNGGGFVNWFGVPILANCILWENAGDQIVDLSGTITVSYSDIQGGWPGSGNIDGDPLFMVTPDSGTDGVWGTEDDDYGDLRLQAGSPCIDAADNTAVPPDSVDLDDDGDRDERTPLDLDFQARFVDDRETTDTGVADPPKYVEVVDMGAYEYQVCAGDLDGDGTTGQADLGILLSDWGCSGGDCPGDLDGDGETGQSDLGILLGDWGCAR